MARSIKINQLGESVLTWVVKKLDATKLYSSIATVVFTLALSPILPPQPQ